MATKSSWMTSVTWLAQAAHFLAGSSFIFYSEHLFRNVEWWIFRGYRWGILFCLLYIIPKEIIIDPWSEGDPFLWDGALDMGVMLAGMLTAVIIVIRFMGR